MLWGEKKLYVYIFKFHILFFENNEQYLFSTYLTDTILYINYFHKSF